MLEWPPAGRGFDAGVAAGGPGRDAGVAAGGSGVRCCSGGKRPARPFWLSLKTLIPMASRKAGS
jgi:hypothetical protein